MVSGLAQSPSDLDCLDTVPKAIFLILLRVNLWHPNTLPAYSCLQQAAKLKSPK